MEVSDCRIYHIIAIRSFLKYLSRRDIKSLAAEKIGLIINSENNASLTTTGQLFINSSLNDRAILAQNLIASLPVFAQVISYFRTNSPISINQLNTYFLSIYPGEASTASRRFSTFMNYIRYLGLPIQQ